MLTILLNFPDLEEQQENRVQSPLPKVERLDIQEVLCHQNMFSMMTPRY